MVSARVLWETTIVATSAITIAAGATTIAAGATTIATVATRQGEAGVNNQLRTIVDDLDSGDNPVANGSDCL
jgi:hypothetical protein